MTAIHAGPAGSEGKNPQSEGVGIEQWVAEQLALAPTLTPGQLDRLQTMLAPAPMVTAKSA
jgi:hypothetical protein